MILNRDHGGFGVKRAVVAFEEDAIGKFQRTVDPEQNFARGAELDDGVLKKNILVFVGSRIVISVAVALGAAEFDGNPHRSGFGKEPSQAAYDVWFKSASSCLVGHGNLNPGGAGAGEPPPLPGLEELRGDSFCLIGIP
jgi:hypothetical protein